MSHIHLPDGVLPVWLWLGGDAVYALLIAVLWRGGRAGAPPRQFALLGIFAALMILVMTIEVPVLGYHFNLSVVACIILGPRLAVLAALMVNAMLALIGHGGITVVGLNSLVISVEMLVGYAVFRLFSHFSRALPRNGFTATLFGLAAGTTTTFAVLALGAPGIDHMLQSATLYPGQDLGAGITGVRLNLTRLALLMFGLGAIGWPLEAWLSSAVLGFLQRVYPEVLEKNE